MVHVVSLPSHRPTIPSAKEIRDTAIQLFKPLADELAKLERRLDAPDLAADARVRTDEIIKLIVVPILNEIERIHGFKITLDYKSDEARDRHGVSSSSRSTTAAPPPRISALSNALEAAISRNLS